jgi:hypothetical protein
MICEHLRPLEEAMVAAGARETWRGQAWSEHCHEFVSYACFLDIPAIRAKFAIPECVVDHVNDDVRTGRERGLVCTTCNDGIIGAYQPGRVMRFPPKRRAVR